MYSIHIKSYIETLCHFDKVFSVLQSLMLYARSLSQEDARVWNTATLFACMKTLL
jgi:hypothetical protein